jgi:ketosteroid isomerase-like protein
MPLWSSPEPMSRRPCVPPEPSRRAARLGLALGLAASGAAGCSGSGAEAFRTAAALPSAGRRPDAVAVDLPTEPPATRERAEAADGAVTLRTPLGVEAARATVRTFFRAIAQEDLNALGAVLSPQAMVQDLSGGAAGVAGPGRTREAINFWGQRFRQHEYGLLASQVIYRDADVETYRAGEADALPNAVRQAASTALGTLAEGDLVLRVPVVTHSIGSERLLGTELCFWLRRSGDHYLIIHLAEPFPL